MMVADAVDLEPVSTTDSLLTGKRTGNFAGSALNPGFDGECASEFNRLQQDSLLNGAGNFYTSSRGFSGTNREISHPTPDDSLGSQSIR
jgi:hypothetical protein